MQSSEGAARGLCASSTAQEQRLAASISSAPSALQPRATLIEEARPSVATAPLPTLSELSLDATAPEAAAPEAAAPEATAPNATAPQAAAPEAAAPEAAAAAPAGGAVEGKGGLRLWTTSVCLRVRLVKMYV